jgi:hypothetical protein
MDLTADRYTDLLGGLALEGTKIGTEDTLSLSDVGPADRAIGDQLGVGNLKT